MEIPAIKQQLPIDQVLTHYNLTPDRNHMLHCPFHADKTPSLQIYPKTDSYCCFSSNCAAGSGDVIDFIQRMENSSKHEAITKAKILLGHQEQSTPTPYPKLFQVFQTNLTKSRKAKEYLKGRNLPTDHVGYNSTGWSQMKNCIIYPLKNREGQVVSFYGRSVVNDTKQRHYYSKGRTGLYPGYPAADTTKLIITESVIDAATLQATELLVQYGVLASYGTNGLTEEHQQAIKALKNLNEIIQIYDGDAAGKEAVLKNGQKLKVQNPHVRISYVETPDGEDINSLSQSHPPEDGQANIFTHLLENRKVLTPGEAKPKAPESKSELDTSNPEYITYTPTETELRFTLLGGLNLHQLDRMKVTLKTAIRQKENPLQSFRHTVDLYNDDQTGKYIRKASERLNQSTSQMSEAISALIHQLEEYRRAATKEKTAKVPKTRPLTEEQKQKALDYLQAPNLMERTNEDIGKTGLVGEETNRLLMYLVYSSRKFKKPLHIISLGASGTGKTYLQEKVSELIPEQDKVELTTSTENAFYYFAEGDLSHKLVLIEDMDGIEHILYPIRELQSKTRISKTVPVKDSQGNMKTRRVEVEGPISLSGTTTKERIYQDNADRCLLIYLDNSTTQQDKIMAYQRKLSAGKTNIREETQYKEQIKDLQSILKPIKVINPYAEQLTIPKTVLKPLRTNAHYLAFIEVITYYHQYQREIKTDQDGTPYIETTKADIQWANRLLKEVLLAKSDELSGSCRRFLEKIKRWQAKEQKQSFYAKQLREAFRINPDNLKYYLRQLHKYGHIKITGGSRYRSGYEYEVENPREYEQLKSNVTDTLDQLLATIS